MQDKFEQTTLTFINTRLRVDAYNIYYHYSHSAKDFLAKATLPIYFCQYTLNGNFTQKLLTKHQRLKLILEGAIVEDILIFKVRVTSSHYEGLINYSYFQTTRF